MNWTVPLGVGIGGALAGILLLWSRDGVRRRSLLSLALVLPALTMIAFQVLVQGHDLLGPATRTVALLTWPAVGFLFGTGAILVDRIPWPGFDTPQRRVLWAVLAVAAIAGLAVTAETLGRGTALAHGTQTYEITIEPDGNGTYYASVPFPRSDTMGGQRALDWLQGDLTDEYDVGIRGGYDDHPAYVTVTEDEPVHLQAKTRMYGSDEARRVFETYRFSSIEFQARSAEVLTVNVTVEMRADDGPTRTCFGNIGYTGEVQTLGEVHETASVELNLTGYHHGSDDGVPRELSVQCQQ